jgi:hypothetical protein
MALAVMASAKCARLIDTQPMCRLSMASASRPSPMMSSVLPPPMSITSRRRPSSGRDWDMPW